MWTLGPELLKLRLHANVSTALRLKDQKPAAASDHSALTSKLPEREKCKNHHRVLLKVHFDKLILHIFIE